MGRAVRRVSLCIGIALALAACDESALDQSLPANYGTPSVPADLSEPPPSNPYMPPPAPPLVVDSGMMVDIPEDEMLVPDDEDCIELRAHGVQEPGDDTPYEVPPGESYMCFSFASPWLDEVQGVRHEPRKENPVVHHHLLYDTPALDADGSFKSCSGSHPNATLIPGWEPDLPEFMIPDDIGFEVPHGTERMFTLEIHYINTTDAPIQDRSGVRICATRNVRPHTASVTWLGTENIGGLFGVPPGQQTTVGGTCTPGRKGLGATDTIQVLGSLPHMHKLGTRMQTIVHRANGEDVTLLDAPFDAGDPKGYPTPLTLEPGDTLETLCTYNNTTELGVPFGPLASQEMCFNFVIAYPARALDNPSFSFSGATNTCLL